MDIAALYISFFLEIFVSIFFLCINLMISRGICEVIGFFSIDLILPAALGPGVYSASNKNEYQELIK
jgi:hypothetical protein